MTSEQTAAFGFLVLSIAIIFALAVIAVPRLVRLLFVRRLEVIRDECVDAILDDRLHETPSVTWFLQIAETGAAHPRFLTLPRLFAFSLAMVDVGIDIERVTGSPSYADLCPEERLLMRDLDRRMCAAYRAYMSWGSPASWLLRPIGLLLARLNPSSSFARAEDAVPAVARETLRDTPSPAAPRVLSHRLLGVHPQLSAVMMHGRSRS